MSGHNIAALHEAIAAVAPDRECIVWRDRRLSWAEVTDRTRRFANGILAEGIGGEPRSVQHGWESPHDHVALYLTNGNEYLEAMVGCWKARAAAVNVNYRYTADELAHVLDDSAAVAIVYHARFAPVLSQALDRCELVRLLVVVDDGSEVAPVPGSVPYEDLLTGAAPARPALEWNGDDRYVVYTGGTTGKPKGVLWRQDDFLASALGIAGSEHDIVERARRPDRPRALPAPPFMHGAAHWNALSCWLAGGTVVIQDDTDRLDPADVLDVCARERVGSLLIVGDAFARPLVDEMGRTARDLSHLRLLMTGGAILSPALKRQLHELLPGLRILDVLGSSETGRHGVSTSSEDDAAEPGVFAASDTTIVLDEDRTRPLQPGEDAIGWLAQRGRVPLGYLGDRTKTEATFPVIDGDVHAVAGDRARLRLDGHIELLGRESVTINTGGEKVHAEEVEQALKDHPSVYDVLVVGRPSEQWGQEIVAVVAPGDGFDLDVVAAHAGGHLARFKLPKDYVEVGEIRRSASGKPDYAWARRVAAGTEVR
ncbi:AMP-binding protein [Actinospongicola halichondriae]|uniref:AMP-binding protein n=1 Tax=Actinospongicola halichondriae TaxID=3236844 RepID=UPI003D3F51B3